MATLTEVSFYTRKFIKWGAVALIIIILIPPLFRLAKQAYLKLNPPPPPAPTVKYGKLARLTFPVPSGPYKPSFKLETIDGQFPNLATVGKVYLVEINRSRLGELERIKKRVLVLGMTQEPERLDQQTYKFLHPTLPATLMADVISSNFSYAYNSDLDSQASPPNREQAILEAKSLFQNMGLLAQDLADGEAKVSYLISSPSGFSLAQSFSDAEAVRVDIFRAPKDSFKFLAVKGDESPVNVIISGANDRAKRIIVANYAYSKILDNEFSTYPLKSTSQAWEELKQGGGYIVKPAGNAVTVRKISLAYYESNTPQAFIQPIFVFEGDNGFLAYVTAVDPSYQE